MHPGYVYKSGIRFVREIASFEDAVAAHQAGEVICLNFERNSPCRVVDYFYDTTADTRGAFAWFSRDGVWFVADVPVGYVKCGGGYA